MDGHEKNKKMDRKILIGIAALVLLVVVVVAVVVAVVVVKSKSDDDGEDNIKADVTVDEVTDTSLRVRTQKGDSGEFFGKTRK